MKMVDVHTKTNFISPDMNNKSPRSSSNIKLETLKPPASNSLVELSPASGSACLAYEHYLRLPELEKLHNSKEFPAWKNESIVKPALQALEITFHLISTVLFDSRVYINKREWKRRLERLATTQVEIIALLSEDDHEETNRSPPITDRPASEISILSQLTMWEKTDDIAQKILYAIEHGMSKCPYTLGLGEQNVTQKRCLNYDLICKPWKINALMNTQNQVMNLRNENRTLYITHQLLETWINTSKQLIYKIVSETEQKEYEKAASQCWLLEKVWKLLTDIEDLHLLMDPDDFLRLKNQLSIKNTPETGLLCFRSKGLVEITTLCKDLRHKVPEILEVEVDPRGGPRITEAAMRLYRRKRHGGFERIHLLQALQAVEMAVKSFYYSYKQLLVIVLGSLEANGNNVFGMVNNNSGDLLNQIFLEPTYYPSLDAAKAFLGYYWSLETKLTRW